MIRWSFPFLVFAGVAWFVFSGVRVGLREPAETRDPSSSNEALSVTLPPRDYDREHAALYRRLASDLLANKRASKADRKKAHEYLRKAEALEKN